MSDSQTADMASTAEAKEASPPNSSGFVYPELDRNKSQFRLLLVEPRDPNDMITATIATYDLPALPNDYNHVSHLSELTAICECLSAATSAGTEVQMEELLRWERLYAELNDLYWFVGETKAVPDGLGRIILDNSDFKRIWELRELFIYQVQRHEGKTRDPNEIDALQALIRRVERDFPNPKFPGAWKYDHYQFRDGYLAVSYCCGDQNITEDISLNGFRIQIPASAARALRGVRGAHNGRELPPVWIDAICIDPADTKERTHQVLLMSKIYSSASKTVVCLESEGETANQLLRDCHSNWSRWEEDHSEHGFDSSLLIDGLPGHLTEPLLKLFQSMLVYLQQPWFGRLWVYQELLLSQKVLFQFKQVLLPWTFIRFALKYYELLSPGAEWLDRANIGILGAATPWRRREHDYTRTEIHSFQYTPPRLTELLLEAIPFKCLEPRDKVYALLGLTSWSTTRRTFPAELKPDYTLPIEECMRNATLAAIVEEMSLECLTLPVWTKRKPSWMVPWHELEVSRNRHSHLDVSKYIAKHALMPDCSRGQKVDLENLRQSNKPGSLFLKGNRAAKVLQVSRINPHDVDGLSFETKLREIIRSVQDLLAGRLSRSDLCSFVMATIWWKILNLPAWVDMRSEDSLQSSSGPAGYEHCSSKETRPDHDESEDRREFRRLVHLIERSWAESQIINYQSNLPAVSSNKWSRKYTEGLDWSISNSRFYLTTITSL
jgi:hypothetical protein